MLLNFILNLISLKVDFFLISNTISVEIVILHVGNQVFLKHFLIILAYYVIFQARGKVLIFLKINCMEFISLEIKLGGHSFDVDSLFTGASIALLGLFCVLVLVLLCSS